MLFMRYIVFYTEIHVTYLCGGILNIRVKQDAKQENTTPPSRTPPRTQPKKATEAGWQFDPGKIGNRGGGWELAPWEGSDEGEGKGGQGRGREGTGDEEREVREGGGGRLTPLSRFGGYGSGSISSSTPAAIEKFWSGGGIRSGTQ